MSVFPLLVFLFFSRELLAKDSDYPVQLPGKMTALSGSCVQIPCIFGVPHDTMTTQNISGWWIKTDHNLQNSAAVVVFDGNITRGFSRIEILGTLKQNNCTTVFYDVNNSHTDRYFFRVKTSPDDSQSYTYSNNFVYISVSDVPQALVHNYTHLQEVMEESTVNLNCSAEAPCPAQPPTISWSYIPPSAHIRTQLQEKPDKTLSVFSVMTFKASYRDHRKNISCNVTYPRNTSNDSTVETNVKLRVLFPPKETNITIDPSASVSVGTNVTFTCKSKANPSKDMNYTWYKRGWKEQLGFGEQLALNVTSTNRGSYFCMAKNKLGNQTSNVIELIVTESESGSHSLIIGCVAALAVFLCLFLLVILCLRVRRKRASATEETDVSDQGEKKQVQISSIYDNSAFETSEEPEMTKDEKDVIHYGEINFSTPQPKSTTVKESGPETIYAMVSNPEKMNSQ